MAFESFIDFVARLGSGGELKRLSQPAATVNELKEERAMVADLLPKWKAVREVTFQISARDERELIARSLHKRAVIRVDRFAQRVQGKST